MEPVAIVLLGLALSADAFAVSVSMGISIIKNHFKYAVLAGLFFGIFQALMPVIGWYGGGLASKYMETLDHWVAFVLLFIIGAKMIWEAAKDSSKAGEKEKTSIAIRTLFILAIATSIDALAVGVSLAFIKASITMPVICIGAITFVLSFAGVYLGKFFGHLFDKKLEVIGGILLIGIGVKILLDHLLDQAAQ